MSAALRRLRHALSGTQRVSPENEARLAALLVALRELKEMP